MFDKGWGRACSRKCSGVLRRRLPLTKKYLLCEYAEKGRTVRDISIELKCDASVVFDRLREFGIQLHVDARESLTGKIIGKWQIGERTARHGNAAYKCVCECGARHVVTAYRLINGLSSQCVACSGGRTGPRSARWRGCGELTGKQFLSYRGGALRRGIMFDIGIEYAWNLFVQQQARCSATGVHLEMDRKESGRHIPGTASIDRIDSSRGYVADNIRWVHKQINRIKWETTNEEFVLLCHLIANKVSATTETPDVTEESILNDRWPRKSGPFLYNWTGYKGITGSYWCNLKFHAKNRGIPFNLDIAEAWQLFLDQKARCFHSGRPLQLRRGRSDRDWNASIDRLDSTKPYELSNVCWSEYTINMMKSDLSVSEFRRWCDLVVNYAAHRQFIA